jgi:hypothetical protein
MPLQIESAHAKYPNIPISTLTTLQLYVDTGCPTGSFMRAVLENDLFEAVNHADKDNQASLVDLVKLIYNDVPGNCHGSTHRVDDWINQRGLEAYQTFKLKAEG